LSGTVSERSKLDLRDLTWERLRAWFASADKRTLAIAFVVLAIAMLSVGLALIDPLTVLKKLAARG
jgi:hypothetical protein